MKARLLSLAAFFGLWAAVSHLGLVKPILLPPLPDVAAAFFSIVTSEAGAYDILSTSWRILAGFLIGSALAIPAGIVLGSSRMLYNSVEWFIDFFRSVPVTAMFPLFLIFFGFGDSSKIAMAAWSCGFTVLVNTIHGVWSSKKNRRIMAVTKGASGIQILSKITFYEALPSIFTGLRVGASWNLIVVVVAEMFIGTRRGLGHLVYNASMVFDTPSVMAGVAVIGILGYSCNRLIMHAERRVVHWKGA
jgi:NitT/TauT family transport system permease protein